MIIIAQKTNVRFSSWSGCVKTYPFCGGKLWAPDSSVCETGTVLFEEGVQIAAALPLSTLLLMVLFLEWRVEGCNWAGSRAPDTETACFPDFLAAWWCTIPAEGTGQFWITFLLIVVLLCPGLWLAEDLETSVEDTDVPGFWCSFLSRLADLEVALVVVWFPLDGCITSLDVTTVVPGSFRGADCLSLSESFLEGPVPVRTRRAFSRARSSNSISSLSPGEVSVSEDSSIQTCGYSWVILLFNLYLTWTSLYIHDLLYKWDQAKMAAQSS